MPKFSVDKNLIRELAALMDETGLTEIEIEDDDRRIRLSKGGGGILQSAPLPSSAMQAAPATGTDETETADPALHPGAVKAPMVGTAYLTPEPGAEPFVNIGDTVTAGQTVMIIEAMKTMNPVEAPRGGKVTAILVSNEQPVEYGEPLLVIE